MMDIANNPTTIAIATTIALGAFGGASYAMLTRKDDEIERYAAVGSVVSGVLGIGLELSRLLGKLVGPPITAIR